jgi:hypothetical protein
LSSGATDGGGQHVDSDGNRVNVRFNADGVNVNNNWDDNRNDNIAVASARKSPLYLAIGMPASRRAFSLPFFAGFDPSAKHSSNFIHQTFEGHIFLPVDCLHLFHEPKEDA